MRILIVSHGHPDYAIGGAEVASHNLFRALQQAGHDAFYLARTAPAVQRHAETPLMSLGGSPNEAFLHTAAWDDFWLSNGAPDELADGFGRYLAHVRPDIVHLHHVIGLGVETLQFVRRVLPEALIALTLHEYLPICHHHGQMLKTQRDTLCRRASPAECHACFPQHSAAAFFQRERFIKDHLLLADLFVSPSRFLIERYVAWGLPTERFRMIENGLAASSAVPARALPPGGRRDRFGFFGQVSAFKGLPVLLDAVARVPAALWGNASLCIFGGNLEHQPEAFRGRFEELMRKAGRRARFFGSYRPEELPRLMQQVDWTVVPSIWWENSPVVIQEAFLHRRPPIVSDIGGMAEKIGHERDGLQFRAGSPEDLADTLGRVLTEPELWQRLSDAAPRPPDLPHFAAAHLAAYAEARAARQPAPPARRLRKAA